MIFAFQICHLHFLLPFISSPPTPHTHTHMQLSVSQDDVWRAVLRWGQHVTGVEGGVGIWREGERLKMAETLDGLVEHIRIMEISDEVFTNEVSLF